MMFEIQIMPQTYLDGSQKSLGQRAALAVKEEDKSHV